MGWRAKGGQLRITNSVPSVMASSTPTGSDTTVVVPRVERENATITTDWWHMITHAHEVPCMGKALGYGGVGGVATGIVNRFVRGRMYKAFIDKRHN